MRSPKINPLSKFLHVEFSTIRQLLSADNYFINMQIEQARMLFLVAQVAKNALVEKASSYGMRMNVRVLLPHHRYASNLESGLLSQVRGAAMVKAPLPKSEYPFKGGDTLEGIQAHYHHIVMINELARGVGAYELKWAGSRGLGTNRSGPSFGGNQMDIAHSKAGRECLLNIIKNVRDATGELLFSKSEIQEIEQILNNPQKMKGKYAEKIFGYDKCKKINDALGSELGKQMIDNVYIFEINSRAQKIEEIVAKLKSGPGKTFAQSIEGKLYLFDYDNQYDISKDGPLIRYLNGEEAILKSGEKIPRFDGDRFTRQISWIF
ncbi:MAG: hypothetical protein K0R73_770 [Candidatus Midichloriaceae bacterium]|jgi:hypothetical protein|nr:hypothetical protein [Candidatus Midichloriaceae bacterium]